MNQYDLVVVVGYHGDDSISFATTAKPQGGVTNYYTGYNTQTGIRVYDTYIEPIYREVTVRKVYGYKES